MTNFAWQKSSYSSGNPDSNCLEAATDPEGRLHFRESDDPNTTLTTTPQRWNALLQHTRRGTHNHSA
ncbi:DUF397 domain-containing protein [Streptomyces sp. ACA25]|uniref:DUF397 domain-containing protein n=1 Tax=Streptomyces sp. ACA25 TaxID=3022596 RepID=UPI002307DA14|nr:DUF397 domain-containing protein [Streptomyces sp. ACA25]MDB1090221.1 DUF397 domain-containing protein [Streptomyces sp. ACA25]